MQKIKKTFGVIVLVALLMITGITLFDRLVPPHGERLVASKDNMICVMNANGWHRRCLIEGTNPTWSPDGQQIAFEFRMQPEDKLHAVCIMTDTGTNLIKLTFKNRYGEHPAWSPDGTQIALSSKQIYVIDSDNMSWQVLTEGDLAKYHPIWSPDGRQIAFTAGANFENDIDIYVMHADGSNVRQLTDDPTYDYGPAWSPDGQQIVFESKRDGNWEIYVVDVDGSNLRRLTDDPADDYRPAWSPDGQQIVFESERDGNWEVYVMDADGNNQTRLTDHPKRDQWPVWSPDGSRIAFLSGRSGRTTVYDWFEGEEVELYDIFVMNADGTHARRLTYGFGKHNYEDIDWSSQ